MENLVQPTFKHDSESLEESLGITLYRASVLNTSITFFFLSARILVEEMYDSIDDAPEYLKSKTYILENCLGICKNTNEQIFMSIIFEDTFQRCLKGLTIEMKLIEEKNSKEEKKTKSFQELMFEKTMDPEAEKSYTNLKKAVKSTGHDFENFVDIINPESEFTEGDKEQEMNKRAKDVGDVLKKLFGGFFGQNPKKDPEEGE